MPLVNWPPAGIPQPPFQVSGVASARALRRLSLHDPGYTWRNPTGQERNLYFTPARCSRGHTVSGVIVLGPGGAPLYPFAVCDAPGNTQRHFLTLWPPYEWPEP